MENVNKKTEEELLEIAQQVKKDSKAEVLSGDLQIEEIVNEDGTPYNPPVNPLIEKWAKLYPPIPKPEQSQVCDGYSCMWCGRCPNGSLWEVPEEDKAVWEEYTKSVTEYDVTHNPSWSQTTISKKTEKGE